MSMERTYPITREQGERLYLYLSSNEMNNRHLDPEGEELGNDSGNCWPPHHTGGSAGNPHCWEFGILESPRSLFTCISIVSAGSN